MIFCAEPQSRTIEPRERRSRRHTATQSGVFLFNVFRIIHYNKPRPRFACNALRKTSGFLRFSEMSGFVQLPKNVRFCKVFAASNDKRQQTFFLKNAIRPSFLSEKVRRNSPEKQQSPLDEHSSRGLLLCSYSVQISPYCARSVFTVLSNI